VSRQLAACRVAGRLPVAPLWPSPPADAWAAGATAATPVSVAAHARPTAHTSPGSPPSRRQDYSPG
jgi:hypothetical protein